jgi:hypothetical protein
MLICSTSRVLVWVRVCWSRVLSKRSNLESRRGDLKILLDWAEKASVLRVASLAVCLVAKGFQFSAYFKNKEFPLIMRAGGKVKGAP